MEMEVGMKYIFADALRSAIALQVAILEVEGEAVGDNIAIPAMMKCLDGLTKDIKAIKKEFT